MKVPSFGLLRETRQPSLPAVQTNSQQPLIMRRAAPIRSIRHVASTGIMSLFGLFA